MAVNLLPPPRLPSEKRLELCPIPHATSSAIATHAEQSQQPILAMMEHHWTQLLDQRQAGQTKWCQLNINPVDPMYM